MTIQDVFYVAFAVLGSLGVGGATVCALASWLGKVWAARILESDRARFQQMLQSTAHQAQQALERLRAESEKRVLVHRVQFEAEFRAYQEIWKALGDAIVIALRLRPVFGYAPVDGTDKDTWKAETMQAYVDSVNAFVEAARRNHPFLPASVSQEVQQLLTFLHEEGHAFADGPGEVGRREYWQGARENRQKIEDQADRICEAIRTRIGLLEVAGSAVSAVAP